MDSCFVVETRAAFIAVLATLVFTWGLVARAARPASADELTISTVAGRGIGDGGPAVDALMPKPTGIATDTHGNVFVADTQFNRIREISAAGTITTIAGDGDRGNDGDGDLAVDATLNQPRGVAVDSAGDVFIADTGNGEIREVTPDGIIQAVGFSTGFLWGIAVDDAGDVYAADFTSQEVIKMLPDGTSTVVAGVFAQRGYNGDERTATSAFLSGPTDVALDGSGNVYIADEGNARVREVVSGTIHTVAGDGSAAAAGDNGAATSAGVDPEGIAFDGSGNLLIADEHERPCPRGVVGNDHDGRRQRERGVQRR